MLGVGARGDWDARGELSADMIKAGNFANAHSCPRTLCSERLMKRDRTQHGQTKESAEEVLPTPRRATVLTSVSFTLPLF